jgi:stringent starvation protein B
MTDPTPAKPYLLRAIYEWCVDNGYTPYISVVVDSRTRVPMEYVRSGEIVLNIGPQATDRLKMGNDLIECSARFAGAARELSIPIAAVCAIYAHENGHGMSFETGEQTASGDDEGRIVGTTSAPDSPEPPKPGKPTLRRIK